MPVTPVTECDVPALSALDRELVEDAYFHDAYRAPLTRRDLSMIDIFFALFGHSPLWVKLALITRNAAARAAGLEAATVAEIMHVEARSSYGVGDKIGPWPIFAISENEIVAGRDNKHLDFRLSVFRDTNGAGPSVVVSTVCSVHNLFGKIYLCIVVPFHRHGVRMLMANALKAKRL